MGSHNSDVGKLVGNWNLNQHHLLLQMTVNVCTSSYIVHSKQIHHTDLDITLYAYAYKSLKNSLTTLFYSLQYIKCN
jgi:hypothetical protein